ncbi:MAG: MmcB family DNA repair protein [Alphaproteobacteria bacterium]|nr:MmcB family DNA repair protein [Alphaproteobacteria bacterium]
MTLPHDNPLGPLTRPPEDGRQSEAANQIRRGLGRLLRTHGLAGIPEVKLPNGRRADVMALSDKGAIWIVEIKSSVADFRADSKWPDYLEFCDRFWFAVAPDFPLELLPEKTGLILADGFGGDIERSAPDDPLPAARRKALTLRFARAAADRLTDMYDPKLAARIEAQHSD